MYSWGDLGYKRITRSCDTSLPSLVKITERLDRRSVDVNFDRFLSKHEPTAIDLNNRFWTLVDGSWRMNVTADPAPKLVEFIGFN